MNFNGLSFCVLASVMAQSSLAQTSNEPTLSSAYEQCEQKSGSVDQALMDCESAEFVRQDKRLNSNYQALLGALSKSKGDELRKVQRAWLTFVESKCKFLYDGTDYNGSLNRLMANHCEVEERARRADELERLKDF
jgi:uncharacterized protein YecT (DUF1311 family)